jgi:hypothetical protein
MGSRLGFVPQPNLRMAICWVSYLNPTYEWLYVGFRTSTQPTNGYMLGFVPQPNLRMAVSYLLSKIKSQNGFYLLGFVPQPNLRMAKKQGFCVRVIYNKLRAFNCKY